MNCLQFEEADTNVGRKLRMRDSVNQKVDSMLIYLQARNKAHEYILWARQGRM